MKNLSVLVLSLVVALPGCCKRKNVEPARIDIVEKSADTTSDVMEMQVDEDGNVITEEDVDLSEDDLRALGINPDDLEDFDLSDLDEMESDEMEMEPEEEGMSAYNMEGADFNDMTFTSWMDENEDEMRKIYFSFNHYGVREDQKASLSYNIEQLKQLIAESDSAAQPTIIVEGHTDQEGDRSYNVDLSEKRARVVADHLVAAGIDRSLIKVIARGPERPVVVDGRVIDGSRDDRAPNRRVEVRVIYT